MCFFSSNVYYENTINSVEDAAVSCVILVLQLFNSHVGILTRRKYFVRMWWSLRIGVATEKLALFKNAWAYFITNITEHTNSGIWSELSSMWSDAMRRNLYCRWCIKTEKFPQWNTVQKVVLIHHKRDLWDMSPIWRYLFKFLKVLESLFFSGEISFGVLVVFGVCNRLILHSLAVSFWDALLIEIHTCWSLKLEQRYFMRWLCIRSLEYNFVQVKSHS